MMIESKNQRNETKTFRGSRRISPLNPITVSPLHCSKNSMGMRLPYELIFNILSRLPVKDLLRYRCVCKSWRSLITDPTFVKTQLDRSNDNHKLSFIVNSNHQLFHLSLPSFFESPNDPTKLNISFEESPVSVRQILGSCNGLLCFFSNSHGFMLLNPSTRELKKLPDLPAEFRYFFHRPYSSVWGFGFSSKTQEYKAVGIMYYKRDWHSRWSKKSQVIVHTVGSNSWRIITQTPSDDRIESRSQIIVNGAPHWEATSTSGSDFIMKIVSFAVGDEVFEEVDYPENEDHGNKLKMDVLGVLKGCLCVLRSFFLSGEVEVWVMEEYGMESSWKRKFSIVHALVADCVIRGQPFWFAHGDEILVAECHSGKMLLYDMKSMSLGDMSVSGIEDWFQTVVDVESLVTL